jgi:hypothetical protein
MIYTKIGSMKVEDTSGGEWYYSRKYGPGVGDHARWVRGGCFICSLLATEAMKQGHENIREMSLQIESYCLRVERPLNLMVKPGDEDCSMVSLNLERLGLGDNAVEYRYTLPPNTSDTRALDLTSTWMDICCESHAACGQKLRDPLSMD